MAGGDFCDGTSTGKIFSSNNNLLIDILLKKTSALLAKNLNNWSTDMQFIN